MTPSSERHVARHRRQVRHMSLGVNLLAALVKRVAQSLDDDFESKFGDASPPRLDAVGHGN